MLRIAAGFLLILACESGCVQDGTSCKFWGYNPITVGQTIFNCGEYANNTCGPALWHGVAAGSSCANSGDQSPINVIPANAVTSVGSLAAADLQLGSPAKAIIDAANTCGAGGEFVIDSHTLQVNIPAACQSGFSAAWTRNGTQTVYNLQQYHFHTPSEHTVDGQFFDMEVQLIHKNTTGNYLALAVFLKSDPALKAKCTAVSNKHVHCQRANFLEAVFLGGMTLPALTAAVKSLGGPPATFTHTSTTTPVDPYKGFVPPLGTHFYWYSGSFTTPPCATGVTWILNPVHVLIYDTTVVAFKSVMGSYVDNGLTQGATPNQNSRPAQKMGLRRLYFVGELGHTTLTQAVLAGATSLPTWAHGGFSVGDTIVIDAGTPRQESNKVVGFGSITLATPLQYAHPAGASVHDQTTTTPGVTVTPVPGAATTTPAATVTPIIPLRRYSESKATAKNEQGQQRASNAIYLGVGCLMGMTVLMVVQNLRSRMSGASTTGDAREIDALLDGESLE